MPTPRVIDLSHHNTVPKDFYATKQAGIIGVIHKCTEGTSYIDDKCQARYYLATQAGLAWGIYHFLRPGDTVKQAEFFFNTAISLGVADQGTLFVADHEDEGVPAQALREFLDRIEDLTGKSPVVYSGHVLKEQLAGKGYRPKRRLWLCQYTTGTPTLPEGVDNYWLWQYTDKGSIAGVQSPVDLNHVDGDINAFLDSWVGTKTPMPTPEPSIATLTLSSDKPITIKLEGSNITIAQPTSKHGH